ncbi:MAG: hypothetical protein A4E67_02520 [Syntrophaceae bacterium PtaB.Bin038]|nr:MAG: hypothetical protein A4E67_02520 [Syntrophaceae bacterium PtaB.Bin038]
MLADGQQVHLAEVLDGFLLLFQVLPELPDPRLFERLESPGRLVEVDLVLLLHPGLERIHLEGQLPDLDVELARFAEHLLDLPAGLPGLALEPAHLALAPGLPLTGGGQLPFDLPIAGVERLQGQAVLLDLRRQLLAAAVRLVQVLQPRFHLELEGAEGLPEPLERLEVGVALLLQGRQGDARLREKGVLSLQIRLRGLPSPPGLLEASVDLEAANVGRLDRAFRGGQLRRRFLLLGQQCLAVEPDHAHALPDPLQLVLEPLRVLPAALELQLRLTDRVAGRLPAVLHRGDPVGQRASALRLFPEPPLETARVLVQLGDLPLAAQQAALPGGGPASPRQDAVGADHVAVRGHQGPPEAVPLPQGDSGMQVGDQEGVAQEVFGDAAELLFDAHHVEEPGRPPEGLARFHVEGVRADPQRDKAAAAGGAGLQVVDGPDALLLALDDDVLQPLTQGRLDGDLVLAGDLDVVGHQPVDAVQGEAGLRPGPDDRARPRVAPLVAVLKLPERGEPRGLLPQFLLEPEDPLIGLLQLGAGALDELLELRGLLPEALQAFLAFVETRAGPRKVPLCEGQAALVLFELPDLTLGPAPEILQVLPAGRRLVLQARLLGEGIEAGGLVLFQPVPQLLLALPELVDVGLPQGEFLPAGCDPTVRLGRLRLELLQLALHLFAAGPQRFQFDRPPLLQDGQVVEPRAGVLDPLLPDADLVFRRVKRLLKLLDALVVLGDLGPELLDAGFQDRELRAGVVGRRRGLVVAPLQIGLLPQHLPEGLRGQGQFDLPEVLLELLVSFGPLGLPRDGVELALDLAHDVVEAKQVLLRRLHLPDGGLLTALVLRDPRGFLDVLAPLLGLGLHEVGDAALLHERVRPGADARVHEKLLHVEQAAPYLVDEILALLVAEDPPRDHHLRAVRVGRGEGIPAGFHDEGHLGQAHGLGLLAAVEDDVVHLLAAQHGHPLLPHDPADGVDDVALAAAVGPHDAADSR